MSGDRSEVDRSVLNVMRVQMSEHPQWNRLVFEILRMGEDSTEDRVVIEKGRAIYRRSAA